MSGLPPAAPPPLTLLMIPEMGVPPYSARGITQSIEPIAASASLERTVNGRLVNLAPPQFQLYRSKISCEDQDPPNSDGFWPGSVVTVYCVTELGVPPGGAAATRPMVPGSQRTDGQGNNFYRPILSMMITKPIQVEREEWAASARWQMELEEVGPPPGFN
jgi:hypothetical protein